MYSYDEEQATDVVEVVELPSFAVELAAVDSLHAGKSYHLQHHKEVVAVGWQIAILKGSKMTSGIADAVV